MGTPSRIVCVVVIAGIAIALYHHRDEPAPQPAVAPIAPRAVAPRVQRIRPAGALVLRLEGQVIDHDGRPVGGVTVELVEPRRRAITEQDGSFGFDGLAAGAHTLYATGEDVYADDVIATLSPTSEPVTLRVRRAGSITIRVTDADSGAAIADATVSDGRRVVVTDAAGAARLDGLPPRSIELEVGAPEHGPVDVRVAIGAERERAVVLARGAPVSGTVVGPKGAPVAGATVELEGRRWKGEVKSDGAGRWRVPALARDVYTITASSDSFAETDEILVKLDGAHPRTGVVVPVVAGGELVGSVVDGDGAAVPGARVRADSASYEPLTGSADGDGRFRIAGMPRSTFQVWAASGDQASPRALVPFGDRDAARTELRLVVAPSTIAGRVVDRAGAPIGDARVFARGATTALEARSDDAGHFELPAPEGAYRLWAGSVDGDSGPLVDAHTGDHGVTLAVLYGAPIRP